MKFVKILFLLILFSSNHSYGIDFNSSTHYLNLEKIELKMISLFPDIPFKHCFQSNQAIKISTINPVTGIAFISEINETWVQLLNSCIIPAISNGYSFAKEYDKDTSIDHIFSRQLYQDNKSTQWESFKTPGSDLRKLVIKKLFDLMLGNRNIFSGFLRGDKYESLLEAFYSEFTQKEGPFFTVYIELIATLLAQEEFYLY